MSLSDTIKGRLRESIQAKKDTLKDTGIIEAIARAMTHCLRNGNRLYFFGNGGSAADAQHLAAKIVSLSSRCLISS